MEPEKCTLEERRVLYRLNPYEVLDYAVQVHEPKVRKLGNVLLLSSVRQLNWANGMLLAGLGYETVTGVVVRDLEETILPQYGKGFDILALSPPIHIEHHELEDFLRFRRDIVDSLRNGSEGYGTWRIENIKRVYEAVLSRQSAPPLVFIDGSAVRDGFQPDITEKGLHEIGIDDFCLFHVSDITKNERK